MENYISIMFLESFQKDTFRKELKMTYKALEDVANAKGYDRKTLAESIGLTYNQLTKRVLGYVQFSLDEIRKIVEILNLSIEEYNFIFKIKVS